MRTDVKKDALSIARHQPRIVEALDDETREAAITQAIETYNNTSQAKEDDLDWLVKRFTKKFNLWHRVV